MAYALLNYNKIQTLNCICRSFHQDMPLWTNIFPYSCLCTVGDTTLYTISSDACAVRQNCQDSQETGKLTYDSASVYTW